MPDSIPSTTTTTGPLSPILITMPGPRTALCPNCVDVLTPATIHFIYGNAFCADCVSDDSPHLFELIHIMRLRGFEEHRTERFGLTFYTPRSNRPRDVYTQRRFDGRHAPIG